MSNIITQTLSYTDSQGVTLQSHFCYPSDATQAVPAVLVAPEWWGLSEHAKHSAERLAAAGYAALAMPRWRWIYTATPYSPTTAALPTTT